MNRAEIRPRALTCLVVSSAADQLGCPAGHCPCRGLRRKHNLGSSIGCDTNDKHRSAGPPTSTRSTRAWHTFLHSSSYPICSRSMLDLPADLIVGDKKPCLSGFGNPSLSDRLVASGLINTMKGTGRHIAFVPAAVLRFSSAK